MHSAWESLPDMSASRADHACEKIRRNGKDYLVVMGGSKGPTLTATDIIEFYDLTTTVQINKLVEFNILLVLLVQQ